MELIPKPSPIAASAAVNAVWSEPNEPAATKLLPASASTVLQLRTGAIPEPVLLMIKF